MQDTKTSIPVLLPNHPVIRLGEDGVQMKAVFTHEAIERILKDLLDQPNAGNFHLYINKPEEGHYNPNYPVGSLMGLVDPEDAKKTFSLEITK